MGGTPGARTFFPSPAVILRVWLKRAVSASSSVPHNENGVFHSHQDTRARSKCTPVNTGAHKLITKAYITSLSCAVLNPTISLFSNRDRVTLQWHPIPFFLLPRLSLNPSLSSLSLSLTHFHFISLPPLPSLRLLFRRLPFFFHVFAPSLFFSVC